MAGLYASVSRRVIRQRLQDGTDRGLEGKELLDYINDGYEWGERHFWPYKVWLREFRAIVGCGPTGHPAKTKAGKLAIARGWDGLKLGSGFGKRIKLGDATRPQLRTEAGHQGRVETEARTRKVFYLTLADAMPDDQKTVQEVFTDDDLQGAFARSIPAQNPALTEPEA